MAATAVFSSPVAPAYEPLRRTPLPLGEAAPPSGELIAGAAGLRVLYDGCGPTVLFVGSAGRQAEAFDAQPFVRAGYEVVRYDARIADIESLASDAIAVLNAVGAGSAHVVGDAAVVRRVAEAHADRVRSATLVGDPSTSDGVSAPTLVLTGAEQPEVFSALVARHLYRSR